MHGETLKLMLLSLQFLPACCYFICLRPKYLPYSSILQNH